MSKYTKGNGSEDTSAVYAVTPENMGKGIKWNPTTQKYEVSVASDTGNLLQVRDSGLYYGYEAKRELRELYVSNDGNDTNEGTRERPIRTFNRLAEMLIDAPVTYYIHLHEGHVFDAAPNLSLPHSNLFFRVYGPVSDSKYPHGTPCNLYYRGYMANDYPRPTIRFITRAEPNVYRRDCIYANKAEFYGIRLHVSTKVTGDDGTRSGYFAGIVNVTDEALFYGCEIVRADVGTAVSGGNSYRDDVLLRGDVVWCTSKMSGVLQWLTSYYYTTTFRIIDWNAGHNNGECGYPAYEAIVANKAEMISNLQPAVSKFPADFNLMTLN